jgi:hypothetical protein
MHVAYLAAAKVGSSLPEAFPVLGVRGAMKEATGALTLLVKRFESPVQYTSGAVGRNHF